MSDDKHILERLDRIESLLVPLSESAKGIKELKEDMNPLIRQAFQVLTRELETVESSFSLEDIVLLVKTALRNTRNLIFALNLLQNITDLVYTMEPQLKMAVPRIINYLDGLEQGGVFRIINSMMGVRAKMAAAYTAEDIDKIGDGLVVLVGLAKKLGEPKARAFLEAVAQLPTEANLAECKPVGPMGLLSACRSCEVKEGLGVIVELTKTMAKIKTLAPVESA